MPPPLELTLYLIRRRPKGVTLYQGAPYCSTWDAKTADEVRSALMADAVTGADYDYDIEPTPVSFGVADAGAK